jgi:hypothetical protein
VSPESQSPPSNVRIAYHADGSATVNGVPVAVEPGQEVRDAAYQAAVGLVVAAGASGPVAATSVEPDGTEYPLTLYPLKAVAAANALVNSAPVNDAANTESSSSVGANGGAGGVGAAVGVVIGGANGLESQFRRVRHAWYRPTLSMSWLVAGACACMVLSVLATVLLQENDPSLEHLQVDTENGVDHSSAARAVGRVMASLPAVVSKPTAKPIASTHRPASAASARATPSKKASAVGGVTGNGSDDGEGSSGIAIGNASGGGSQSSGSVPKPRPTPKPRSAPGDPGPVEVTNLTLALVGGDQTDLGIAYVVTVSTNNTNPVTLTYSYAGKGGRATVRRRVVLSGQTGYVLANLIPAQPYCGGAVTMTTSTSPTANNGTVTVSAPSGC